MQGGDRPAEKDEPATAQTIAGSRAGASSEEAPVLAQPSRIGRFVLMRELGSGGMGAVFAAFDEKLDRKVALKILSQSQPGGEVQRTQILREARAVARISHPNVIAVYEVGEADEQIHIAMEYVDGGTLLQWQSQGGHDWQEILKIYLQAGEALAAAHEAEVVHRDFKPDNVLIGTDGRARVVDFGLARLDWSTVAPEPIEESTPDDAMGRVSGRLTLPGVISGTPGYMSPEQYTGGDVDHRSDQWSFCAALFEALYGFLPFAGETVLQYRRAVHGAPRPRPHGSKVPEEVHLALLRGLSADPDARFATMKELLAVLSREQSGDAAAGTLARTRFSMALVLAALIAYTAVQLRQMHRPVTHRDALAVSVVMTVVLLGGGLFRWRTLFSNRFHRAVYVQVIVTVLQNLLQRILVTVLHLPITMSFPFEMIVMAGSFAVMAATHIPWVRFMPPLVLGIGALQLTGWVPQRILGLAYPLIALCVAVGWSKAAKQVDKKRRGAEFGNPTTRSGRRITSSSRGTSSSRRTTPRTLQS